MFWLLGCCVGRQLISTTLWWGGDDGIVTGYWEIKLQTTGVWGLGVALRTCTLDNVPLGTDIQSWVLRSDGTVFHGGQACAPHVAKDFEDGDILVRLTALNGRVLFYRAALSFFPDH